MIHTAQFRHYVSQRRGHARPMRPVHRTYTVIFRLSVCTVYASISFVALTGEANEGQACFRPYGQNWEKRRIIFSTQWAKKKRHQVSPVTRLPLVSLHHISHLTSPCPTSTTAGVPVGGEEKGEELVFTKALVARRIEI